MRRLETNLRPRRAGFVLTPLIDIIFLLLKFFMLTSMIAPYGLLQVASAGGGDVADGPPPEAVAASKQVTMRISRGLISAGDRAITIGELPEAIAALKEAGITGAILLTSRSATVQDVVSVLEAFKVASFGNVTLLSRGGGS